MNLHPAFQPREYCDVTIEMTDDGARISIADCPALREREPLGWFPLLQEGGAAPALEAIVQGVDPRARLRPAADNPVAWNIDIGESAAPAPMRLLRCCSV